MLPRRLEPEVMDTAEEARDYDEMDHSAVNQLFVTDFLKHWNGQSPILDVGTGTAQIPIELCKRDARAQLIGVDLSNEMLKLGRANLAKAGCTPRMRLDLVDAKGLPYADGEFAAVISNSASRKGGAILFFTTFTRALLPTASSPFLTTPVRRMSRRTEA